MKSAGAPEDRHALLHQKGRLQMQSPSCTYDLTNQQLRDPILLLVDILLHLKALDATW